MLQLHRVQECSKANGVDDVNVNVDVEEGDDLLLMENRRGVVV